jgi:hypothetical protein
MIEKLIVFLQNMNKDALADAAFFGFIVTAVCSVISFAVWILGVWLLLPLSVFAIATGSTYVVTVYKKTAADKRYRG